MSLLESWLLPIVFSSKELLENLCENLQHTNNANFALEIEINK